MGPIYKTWGVGSGPTVLEYYYQFSKHLNNTFRNEYIISRKIIGGIVEMRQNVNYDKLLKNIKSPKTREFMKEIMILNIPEIDYDRNRYYKFKNMRTIHGLNLPNEVHYAIRPSSIEIHVENEELTENLEKVFWSFQDNLEGTLKEKNIIEIKPNAYGEDLHLEIYYYEKPAPAKMALEFKIVFNNTYSNLKNILAKQTT